MARIKAPKQPPRAPTSIRGALVFRATANGIVVAAWPPKRGRAKSGSQLFRQLEFGIAAYVAAHPNPFDLKTAIEQAPGTTMVPRDMLQMAAMGTFWEITDEDGNEWKGWRMVQANAQFMLDQVTNEVGSLLFRAPIGWVGLDPGGPGQLLRMAANGLPAWSQAGEGTFAGATVIRTTDLTNQDWTTQGVIPWQAETINQSGWDALAASGERIVIPAGITIAEAVLVADITAITTGSDVFGHINLRSAAHAMKKQWRSAVDAVSGQARPDLVSTPWPVEPGDYFTASILIVGDASVTLSAATSAFSVQGW